MFLPFEGGLKKMYRINGKFLVHFKEILNFLEKVEFWTNFKLFYHSFPKVSLMIRQVSHVCLLTKHSEFQSNQDYTPLIPHFYVEKAVVYKGTSIFLVLRQNFDSGYSLELPQQGDSNVYPQSIF